MVSPGISYNQDNACHMSLKYHYHENIFKVLDHVKDQYKAT